MPIPNGPDEAAYRETGTITNMNGSALLQPGTSTGSPWSRMTNEIHGIV